MAVTDAQVRQAAKGIITAAYPAAMVYGWNVLSHDLREWPGLFRMADANTHGWIIKRNGAESAWKRLNADRSFWIYDIWGFYGFRSGKETDNSDEEFATILQTVYDGFKAKPTLDVAEIEEHELLQYDLITTIDCGEETLHWAKGKLRVRLCC